MRRFRLIGALMVTFSILIIILSFANLFLGYRFEIFQKIPPILIHFIEFLVILIVFGYIAYTGIIMLTIPDDER
ncbi:MULTISPECIES: hypothetical protein [Metallosphaera]|uniref:hypothetical protein n=1 Tax=Metallosphaera TaxID=41980 RepID=UPI001F06B28C|nr:hypothetical protein [Metallosphaera sedula]MCH1770932.1 hypothetical protein [Metallosphaera sedula]MCP6729289.1 hypothetical protein [Metallosphaera sedula]